MRDESSTPGLSMEERVIESLRTLYDPELPVNIYDLGLIYALEVDDKVGKVDIKMTLTAPSCPVAQSFPAVVEEEVMSLEGVTDVRVELLWEPQWTKERMSEAARLSLNML